MKPIPPGMTLRDAFIRGYAGRVVDKDYLSFVRSLPCACCGSRDSVVAHHPIDVGFKGMGTKVPDYWAIPLTARCHDTLHFDVKAWEALNGPQIEHAALTMTLFIDTVSHLMGKKDDPSD